MIGTDLLSAFPNDVVGWMAATLTLMAFSMRSMTALRLSAVGANVCFIIYGLCSHLYPVMALHLLLLPCNVYRICEIFRQRAQAAAETS